MDAFVAALLAAFFLSLQGALMAAHYRRLDELSAVAYRGLSLGISFAPLLLFVPVEIYPKLPQEIPLLLLAAMLAGVANTFAAISVRILVIRVANTVAFSTIAFVSALIDALYYRKFLSLQEMFVIMLLFVALFFFSKGSGKHVIVRERTLALGIVFSVLFGICIAFAFAIVGELSKRTHPLLIGYSWELSIGIWTFLLCLGRKAITGKGVQPISGKTFVAILLASAPTALGTGLYLFALSSGQLALVSTLLSTTMVFSLLFGAWLYRESFGVRELGLLSVITVLISLLKIVSPL